ncbi:MAG: hypothetical protein R6U35_06800 [Candidatus Humimicrobiaceae bacterium]
MQRRIYVREIYFYIVCLIAIILFIVGIINLTDNIINYINPLTYAAPRAQVRDIYREQNSSLTEEEINKLVEEEAEYSLQREKNMSLRGMLRGSVMIVLSIPLFVYHWKKARELWNAGNG